MKKVVLIFIVSLNLFASDMVIKMPSNLGMHTICVGDTLYFKTQNKKGNSIPTERVLYSSHGEFKPINCSDTNQTN